MLEQILHRGPLPEQAAATMILMHGRGASAESIMTLYAELGFQELAALAPQAPGYSWYPNSFLAPLSSNQPHLDTALLSLESLTEDLFRRGVDSRRLILLGFSQGACLTVEFVARHPRRYGAVVGLIGGLIGPPGTPRAYSGDLLGTPVFLGSSDPDAHVPFSRVEESAAVLSGMGGQVDLRRYAGLGHTICSDQLQVCGDMIRAVLSSVP